MATWANTTLSTLASIAEHEAEINDLPGTHSIRALSVTSTSYVVVVPDTLAELQAVFSDGGVDDLVYNAGSGRWYFQSTKTVINLFDPAAKITFPIGSAAPFFDTTTTFQISATNATFTTYNVQSSFQTKIDLAKKTIALELKTNLQQKNYTDEWSTTGEILDNLTDTDVLGLASDYLTLALIYVDLFNSFANAMYETKLKYYNEMYRTTLAKALPLVLMQLNGGPTGYQVFTQNKLSV